MILQGGLTQNKSQPLINLLFTLSGGGLTLAQLMEQSGQDGNAAKGISEEDKEEMRRQLEEQIRREMQENEKQAVMMSADAGNQWNNEVRVT